LIGTDPLSIPVEKDVAAVSEVLRRLSGGETGPISLAFIAARKDGSHSEMQLQAVRANFIGRPAIVGMAQEITKTPSAA
jgi:hypothetical protein